EAMAVLGRVGPVHAIAIELPRRHVVEIAVPDVFAAFGQLDAFELTPSLIVEQAKLDLLRVSGEQRKIGPAAVPACTEARGRSRRQSHIRFPVREISRPEEGS